MLSILIPTYNYDCTSLLETIKNQTRNAALTFEIIVCDDASTLESSKIQNSKFCKTYDIIYLENDSNLGRTQTRSILAKNATYDWLLFLDADVIPCDSNFISNYTKYIMGEEIPVIIGGVNYQKEPPKNQYALRWKFGHKREARDAEERNKQPYLLASANLLIKKNAFLKVNTLSNNNYGLDALFGYRLQEQNIQALHIENPIFHLGLETNEVFLNKSLKAIETLFQLENDQVIPSDHTRLQKMYNGLIGKIFIRSGIEIFKNPIKKNLLGSKPSLFLFDIYRLYHYIKLKSNA